MCQLNLRNRALALVIEKYKNDHPASEEDTWIPVKRKKEGRLHVKKGLINDQSRYLCVFASLR
jgi:hypothetical protein